MSGRHAEREDDCLATGVFAFGVEIGTPKTAPNGQLLLGLVNSGLDDRVDNADDGLASNRHRGLG